MPDSGSIAGLDFADLLPVESENLCGLTLAQAADLNYWDFVEINLAKKDTYSLSKKDTVSSYQDGRYTYNIGNNYSFSATNELDNPSDPTKVYSTYKVYSSTRNGMNFEIYGGDVLKKAWDEKVSSYKRSEKGTGDDAQLEKELGAKKEATEDICRWGLSLIESDSLKFPHQPGPIAYADKDYKDKPAHYMQGGGSLFKDLKNPINPEEQRKEKFFLASKVCRVHQSDDPNEDAIRYDVELMNHNLNMSGVISSFYAGVRVKLIAAAMNSYFLNTLSLKCNQAATSDFVDLFINKSTSQALAVESSTEDSEIHYLRGMVCLEIAGLKNKSSTRKKVDVYKSKRIRAAITSLAKYLREN